jgi:hypothetical protein
MKPPLLKNVQPAAKLLHPAHGQSAVTLPDYDEEAA